MKRRTIVKGVAVSVTATWVLPQARAQISRKPLVPVWMGEDMARRMIELIRDHEAPEDRGAMIVVFEHAIRGAYQPPPID